MRPKTPIESKTATKYTAFRCPEELLEPLRKRAEKDRRSLSNYIIVLIERDVRGDDTGGDADEGEVSKPAASAKPSTRRK